MTKEYDVIVIGAGNGGLMSAVTTSKQGLKTLLIEKHNLPGGCATSFRRGRFEFEPSLHELAGYGSKDNPGAVRQIYDSLGINIEMLKVDDAYRYIVTGKDGFDVTMPTGIAHFINQMEEEVPGSRISMGKFFSLAQDVMNATDYMASVNGKIDPKLMASKHSNFMKISNQSLQDVLDLIEMPKKAQEILCAYWCYMGMPPKDFEFVYYALMVTGYIALSAYVPKMRSHDMSSSIEKKIFDFGGEIWYNTEVTEILVKENKAYGVKIGEKEIYSKEVIANINPHTVFSNMISEKEIPIFEVKKANARKFGAKGLCVYLGLDKSPEELGIKDYSVFIANNPSPEEQFEDMHSIEKNSFQIMNCLNIVNPTCSPKGTSILWATTLYYGDTWEDVKIEDYYKKKNEVAKRIIENYEKATGIKISDSIEEIEIAAPPTFARYINSPSGTIYGYYGEVWDGMLSRTMTVNSEETIKNLHLCGGHGERLDGYSSTYFTGIRAANTAIKEIEEGL